MSKIGLKHLRRNGAHLNGAHFSGLSTMQGGFLSQRSPLWSPQIKSITDRYPNGDYDFGAAAIGPLEIDDEGMRVTWGGLLLYGAVGFGLVYLYNNFIKKGKKNPAHRKNRRRKRNGTKKGMVRKTARRAYMKNGTKKGMRRKTARRAYMKKNKNKRAAKAMKLYHSGKARSLKAAWKMV